MMLVEEARASCDYDLTKIAQAQAETIAAPHWPPAAAKLPWITRAYPPRASLMHSTRPRLARRVPPFPALRTRPSLTRSLQTTSPRKYILAASPDMTNGQVSTCEGRTSTGRRTSGQCIS